MSLFLLFSSLFAKICQLLSKQFLFSKTSSRSLQDVFSVTLFVFQDLFKTSSRRLQDVFKTYLQYVFLKRLQGVFKTSSRRVCKTSCNYIFKTSSRRLGRQTNVTLKTSWRRLHQDECLLGECKSFNCRKKNVLIIAIWWMNRSSHWRRCSAKIDLQNNCSQRVNLIVW